LPDRLPEPKGWQLAALWQPALQVSGDFYDAFTLSDNRIGIVIADVADKGMPAALFMTLIRTLVRSVIREIDSPAEVLIRVNDLLLPDAKGGMFVTLAYCVVHCSDGRLVYANAGHNPPILLRHRTGIVEELVRTGMALGVMQSPSITETELQLDAGDLLLLYTDGITEAFSPEGEMFGDQRLLQTVSDSKIQDPELLAENVMGLLEEFITPLPYSDDLTMIIIKRNLSEG
jgi:serine phosphatase RsbU (regulator of sigma subunit)